MNTKRKSGLRLFLAPLLAILILFAAMTISDSYNSSQFAEPDSKAASAQPVPSVSAADMMLLTSGTDAEAGGLTVTYIPVTPSDSAVTTTEDTQAHTSTTTTVTTSASTATASSPAEQPEDSSAQDGDAAHVNEPDYGNEYYIVVYTGSQNVLIYRKGADGKFNDLVKCFICSSGKKGHSTRLGMYSIIRRYRWRLLVGDVYGQYSTGFSSSYLFHSVPYLEENDPSSLDMDEYNKLGQPASKGCIRLCVRDAKWIFENCPDGTQINIVDDYNDTPGEPLLPLIDEKKFAGWDPSDPDPDSPYNTNAVG